MTSIEMLIYTLALHDPQRAPRRWGSCTYCGHLIAKGAMFRQSGPKKAHEECFQMGLKISPVPEEEIALFKDSAYLSELEYRGVIEPGEVRMEEARQLRLGLMTWDELQRKRNAATGQTDDAAA